METPSSITRVTRSQTAALNNNGTTTTNNIPVSRKVDDSDKGFSKSRQRNGKQQDRSALIDITNDSPIVGLATGSMETPLSSIAKQRNNLAKTTPGSGEALLRGQVKTLLQKVEEEAELSKLSMERRPFLHLQGFVNSPMTLLAPTPANTPHILNLSADQGIDCLASMSPSLVIVEEQLKISEVVNGIFNGEKQESLETEKSLITRSLLLDFSEKSETSDSSECSSLLTYQGGLGGGDSEGKQKASTDDDDASDVWSIQVNASTHDEDEEVIEEEEEDYNSNNHEEEEYYEEDEGLLVDELCEGMNKMTVKEKITAKFTGKHTRFMYDSDGEIVEECGASPDLESASPSIMRLKGLPTPKGKHLRFHEQEEDN